MVVCLGVSFLFVALVLDDVLWVVGLGFIDLECVLGFVGLYEGLVLCSFVVAGILGLAFCDLLFSVFSSVTMVYLDFALSSCRSALGVCYFVLGGVVYCWCGDRFVIVWK